MMKPKFTYEIRLGEVLAAAGMVATAVMAWTNWNIEFAGIKAAQAAAVVQGQKLESSVHEVREEVKDTGIRVRSLESRMDRARM